MLDPWLRRRGWTFDGSRLTGDLRHQDGTTQARMDLRDGGFEVFLRQPPQWLRQHPEFGGCVQHRGRGWYLLNQHTRFNDPKTVVIAAEDFMQECFDTSTDVEESEE